MSEAGIFKMTKRMGKNLVIFGKMSILAHTKDSFRAIEADGFYIVE